MKKKINLKAMIPAGVIIIVLFALLPVSQNLLAQKKDNPPKVTGNKPKVDIQVNRKVDKNGNVTQYDSTYTWSWSGNGPMPANVDSIFKSMQDNFAIGFNFDNDPFMTMPMGKMMPSSKDSSSGIFNPFEDFFGSQAGTMDKMMQEHQKMLEQFFNQQEEPVLKVPDGVGEKPSAKPEKPVAPQKKSITPQKQDVNKIEQMLDQNHPLVNT